MQHDSDDPRHKTIPHTRVVPRSGDPAPARGPSEGSHGPFLTVLAGGPIGKVFELDRSEAVIGRAPGCAVFLDDDSVSRRHAVLRLTADGTATIQDLGSTNGTFVNGDRVECAQVHDGDRLLIGSTAVLKLNLEDSPEARAQRHLYEAAHRDVLTGLYNQRAFQTRFAEEFSFARRHHACLALILVDVDQFKLVNDRYGHGAGDELLPLVAAAVRSALRDEDVLCRCGGDELAVILRDIELSPAAQLAERIRASVARDAFTVRDDSGATRTIPVTVSVGVAALDHPHHLDRRDLLDAADRRLLRAKRNGRNRICSTDTD